MRNAIAAILAVAVGTACGGSSWTGEVSGYSLEPKEALFTVITDMAGRESGLMVVLSDQPDLCPQLVATKAPPNTTVATFVVARQANNNPLSPDVGEYPVILSTPATAMAMGIFFKTDAHGTNAIPKESRMASSGVVTISQLSLEQGTLSGEFDGTFGFQSTRVTAAFQATQCGIDSPTLVRGFLFNGTADQTVGGARPLSPECAQMISCTSAVHGASAARSFDTTYGPAGSCWTGDQVRADACTRSCRDTLEAYQQISSSPPACR